MFRKIYLAIDDDPVRYYQLSQQLNLPLMVTCRLSEVQYYMSNYRVQGILLDHDMPFSDGYVFANILGENYSSRIPVVIASQNPIGSRKIEEILIEYGFNCIRSPVTDSPSWNENVLKFLHYNRPLE